MDNDYNLNVNFEISKVSVSGELLLLDKDLDYKFDVYMRNKEDVLVAKTIANTFSFEDVLPGVYVIEVKSEKYCWQINQKTIKV